MSDEVDVVDSGNCPFFLPKGEVRPPMDIHMNMIDRDLPVLTSTTFLVSIPCAYPRA
jgi:hypothetical protein